MTKSIYEKLREFLDNLPGGFPATESGVELKILKKLFTEEQARLITALGPKPQAIDVIAEKIGVDEEEASAKYEAMAKEGLIYRLRNREKPAFLAISFVIGIYEFHLNTIDRELAELFEEFIPHLHDQQKEVRTKSLRIIPVEAAVESTPEVASYDRVRELAEQQTLISVAPCICQKERRLLGDTCDKPEERCFQFGFNAEYYIENGLGRPIELDEFKTLLAAGDEAGLVLEPMNTQGLVSICMCCECCCPVLGMVKKQRRPVDHVRTSFRASIDQELCTACSTCEDRCPMDATIEGDDFYEIDRDRCIGCGLCVTTCPDEAISLVPLPGAKPVPQNLTDLAISMMRDRGLI